MQTAFPDATEEELDAADRICIICREPMTSAKKLRCGHMFHFHCLRSWLERQQTCPYISPISPLYLGGLELVVARRQRRARLLLCEAHRGQLLQRRALRSRRRGRGGRGRRGGLR